MRKETKRKTRKLLAVVTAAALVLGAVPGRMPAVVNAMGAEEDSPDLDGLEWDAGKTVITGDENFTGTVLDLRGTNVTRISQQAFQRNKNITEVYLPTTLKSIGKLAFDDCSSLRKVTFESSSTLETIDSMAFQDCSALTSFTLPDTVTSIGASAFAGCDALTKFNISVNSSLNSMGDRVFYSCDSLTGSMLFPAALNSLGENAFCYTYNLKMVEFKNKDTTLGSRAFEHNSDWDKNVVFFSEPGGSVEKYARDNGFRFNSPGKKKIEVVLPTAAPDETADPNKLGLSEFFYGEKIDAAALQQRGITLSADFAVGSGTDETRNIKLSDCMISGFNTKEAGKQSIKFFYLDQEEVDAGKYKEEDAALPIEVFYDMSTARISSISSQTYTGTAVTPEDFTVTLRPGYEDTLTLRKGTDYDVTYTNNTNVGTATITLTGKGNYKGTITKEFEIRQQNIRDVMEVHVESETVKWTGEAVTPNVTVTLGDKELVKDKDYTLAYANNVNPGTATVTVTGKGNYSGSKQASFKVIRDISEDMEVTVKKAGSLEYTGDPVKPEIVVRLDGEDLWAGTDYTVQYKNNVQPGEDSASVIVTGTGYYSGSQENKFTILPKNIQDTMSVSLAQTSVTYTGTEQKPKVTVYMESYYDQEVLREGKDYTLTYADNTDVGTASVTVTCIGVYAGEVTEEFAILPLDISEKAEAALGAEEMEYTGQELKPEVTVELGNKELVQDKDFKVQYKNNTDAGTAEVSVSGKGNYSGTIAKTFRIFHDITGEMKISLVEDELEFTGRAVVPAFTVAWNGTVLTPEEDFDVICQNNINVGTAQMKVTCKGKYKGEAAASFTITKRDITEEMDCVLSYDEAEATGEALKPGVTVRLGGKTLVRDVDYTVAYADNVNPGTATVTVTAKGNYEGTAVLNFTIKQSAAQTPGPSETGKPSESETPSETGKPSETGDPAMTPDPSQPDPSQPGPSQPDPSQPGPSQPGTVTPGTPSTPANPSTPSVADDADDDDDDDDDDEDGDDADGVKARKVKNLKAKNDKKKSVTLTWSKVRKAKSYQIQYSTSKKFKGSKTKVSGKAKATLKGMKKKQTYYIRVRACIVSGGKKVYGAWSAVKKVKVKK